MGVPQPLQGSHMGRKRTRPLSEVRKIRKPLMEKKRRDRINACLTSLATLLIGTGDTSASEVPSSAGNKKAKFEKADILEKTVKHWQKVKASKKEAEEERGEREASENDSSSFVQGYKGCIEVVDALLQEWEADGDDIEFCKGLRNHLQDKLTVFTSATDSGDDKVYEESKEAFHRDSLKIYSTGGDAEELTLIPTLLSSGDFALVVKEFSLNPESLPPGPSQADSGSSSSNVPKSSEKSADSFEARPTNYEIPNVDEDCGKGVWRPW